jgi:hypothetical protein
MKEGEGKRVGDVHEIVTFLLSLKIGDVGAESA